jgi:signal transduction histidine kinase
MKFRKAFLGIFSTMTISLLTLILFLWLAYQRSLETKMRTDAVEHTYQVRLTTKDLLEAILNIETGARGYSMTHDKSYLLPFTEGNSKIKGLYKSLKVLVKDNAVQLKRLDSLDRFMDMKLKLIKTNIEIIESGGKADMTLVQAGKQAMDEVRGITTRFLILEEQFQIEREQNQLEADRNLKIYSMIFSGLALLFLLLFFRILYQELKRRFEVQLMLEQNITELKRANIELEQFSNIASHDLQEPLRKIRTFGERLLRKHADNLDEDGKFNITRINDAALRMQTLIQDLLAFSHTTNVNERKYEAVNLNKVLYAITEELALMILDKKAQINVIPAVLPNLIAIPFQIHQLFSNLISNAIKYSQEGVSPIITITHEVVMGTDIEHIEGILIDNNYYHFMVIDNGIGFESMYAEKIFIIFQRLHTRNEYDGTGIGLAICRRIVANHKGFISAESQHGEGSTFHIYLPKT